MTTSRPVMLRRSPFKREMLRWGIAAAAVTAAHAALAYGLVILTPPRQPAAVEEAMTVELTPLVVSLAEAVENEAVTEDRPEQVAELEEETETEPEITGTVQQKVETQVTEEETVETAQAETQVEEPIEERPGEVAEVEPAPEIAEDQPEIVQPEVEVEKAEVVIPPRPKPVRKPRVETPRRTEVKKPEVRKVEPKPVRKPRAVAKKAEPRPEKPSVSRRSVAARATPKAPAVNPSRWFAQVQSAIARRKPGSRGATGRVSIRFTVNSSGSITSAGIARSSGNPALDRAALGMVRGGRVPAPPPGLGRASHSFTIPVSFQ